MPLYNIHLTFFFFMQIEINPIYFLMVIVVRTHTHTTRSLWFVQLFKLGKNFQSGWNWLFLRRNDMPFQYNILFMWMNKEDDKVEHTNRHTHQHQQEQYLIAFNFRLSVPKKKAKIIHWKKLRIMIYYMMKQTSTRAGREN